MKNILLFASAGIIIAGSPLLRADAVEKVTVENFARAESDLYFAAVVKNGGFGKLHHDRELTPIDRQTVIRMNRDTLYSSGVFDLDAGPVTITLPDTGKRFISMQVINEDHYTVEVVYAPGSYQLTREKAGTRYVFVAIRLLVDPTEAADYQKAHALQDAIKVEQANPGSFEIAKWDLAGQTKLRDALNIAADSLPERNRMFGTKEEVDPVRHLLGTSSGWGGNPEKEATYLSAFPEKNDGKTIYRLNVKEVPVDAFWSISVYNDKGFYEKNDRNRYTVNNLSAVPNKDGSITIQFGGKEGDAPNVLPITPGWNYTVRLYRPKPEILSGEWQFPTATPVAP